MTALWEWERKPRLLVIENSLDLGNFLNVYLSGLGAEVVVLDRGYDGLSLFSSHVFDLVILDVMLPDIIGYEVLKSIKASGSGVPVFFLTQHPDTVKGLELGADDYILIPFDAEELLFRIKVGLRHRVGYHRSAV